MRRKNTREKKEKSKRRDNKNWEYVESENIAKIIKLVLMEDTCCFSASAVLREPIHK